MKITEITEAAMLTNDDKSKQILQSLKDQIDPYFDSESGREILKKLAQYINSKVA